MRIALVPNIAQPNVFNTATICHECLRCALCCSEGMQDGATEQPQPPQSASAEPNTASQDSQASDSKERPPPSADDAKAMSQLLAGFSRGGGNGGTTAADLVAQLSQSGASAQMLFDAISALPQVRNVNSQGLLCCTVDIGCCLHLYATH